MHTKRIILAGLLLTLALAACVRVEDVLTPNLYRAWMERADCPLRTHFKSGPLTYAALYKPPQYVALLEAGSDAKAYPEFYKASIALQHFNIWINNDQVRGDLLMADATGQGEYSSRLNYCMGAMQNDLYLEEDGARYPCVLFQFVRTHGLSPGLSFVAAFQRPADELEALKKNTIVEWRDKTLVFNDGLFGNGFIHLVIHREDLGKQPQLKI